MVLEVFWGFFWGWGGGGNISIFILKLDSESLRVTPFDKFFRL